MVKVRPGRHHLYQSDGGQGPRHAGDVPRRRGQQTGGVEAARVPARPAPLVQRLQVEPRPAHQEVVRDEDAAHRRRRVSDEPLEDVAGPVLHQLPRLDHDADHPGDQGPDTEGDAALPEVSEVVGRAARLVASVARPNPTSPTTCNTGVAKRDSSRTGSETAWP